MSIKSYREKSLLGLARSGRVKMFLYRNKQIKIQMLYPFSFQIIFETDL